MAGHGIPITPNGDFELVMFATVRIDVRSYLFVRILLLRVTPLIDL